MDAIINSVQQKIKIIEGINYVDEDWGQLDYYSPNFPVQWPCALIDVSEAHFKNIGKDVTASPVNRQTADVNITITIATMRLNNSSGNASRFQKEAVRSIHKIIEDVHKKIHGKKIYEKSGTLIRKSMRRIKRDDGVQEYNIVYTMPVSNI